MENDSQQVLDEDEELVEVCADCEQDPCVCEDEVAELAEEADDKVDALINILIKKGIFTEEEFEKEFQDMFEEDSLEDDSGEVESEADDVPPSVTPSPSGDGMRTF